MMRLKSSLVDLVETGIAGNLPKADWDERKTVGIVLASGYPETSSNGDVISGLDTEMMDAKVFHAGTKANENGDIVTTWWSCTLCDCIWAIPLVKLKLKLLELCQKVTFDSVQYRKDIGYRAIAH